MDVYPGEPARNAARMLELMAEAREKGVDLLAFPEMCLPGYLLGDMWERPAFLKDCEAWSEKLIAATAMPLFILFGTVCVDWKAKGEDGRPRKYNGFVLAGGGKAIKHTGTGRAYGIKTLLPNYREFEEPRHFYDTRKLALETGRKWQSYLEPYILKRPGGDVRLGVLLCEDAWEDDYAQKPLQALGRKRCDAIINLSCSPFTQGKNGKRNRVFSAKAKGLKTPMLYVNAVSLQNNAKTLFTFDGRSTAYSSGGKVIAEMPAFTLGLLTLKLIGKSVTVMLPRTPLLPQAPAPRHPEGIAELHQAIRFGAKAYLDSIGQSKVVIGVSGGIDSAVAAALYAEILPPENILLVNMPSRFNSGTTIHLARALAKNLGCLYAEVGIEESVALTRRQLDKLAVHSLDGKHATTLELSGLVLENIQARDRSSRILSALSAAFGGVFACNANKAELTVGYSTLYGDLGGFLALLGDLWKGEVYALGRYLNSECFRREVIPEGIFTVVPSAELSSAQDVDQGKGDPLIYPYHDRLFYSFVQRWNRATPEEILEAYADGTLNRNLGLVEVDAFKLFPIAGDFIADLEKWWGLYNGMAVAKRVQAPPIMAVSSRAFGFDHRAALGRPFLSERYRRLRAKLLA